MVGMLAPNQGEITPNVGIVAAPQGSAATAGCTIGFPLLRHDHLDERAAEYRSNAGADEARTSKAHSSAGRRQVERLGRWALRERVRLHRTCGGGDTSASRHILRNQLAQSMRAPTGFATPVPRRGREPLGVAWAVPPDELAEDAPVVPTRDGDVASGVVVFMGFLCVGFGGDVVALAAGTRDTNWIGFSRGTCGATAGAPPPSFRVSRSSCGLNSPGSRARAMHQLGAGEVPAPCRTLGSTGRAVAPQSRPSGAQSGPLQHVVETPPACGPDPSGA
jgi:hypothetical protein